MIEAMVSLLVHIGPISLIGTAILIYLVEWDYKRITRKYFVDKYNAFGGKEIILK
jgi:hypothetical protein